MSSKRPDEVLEDSLEALAEGSLDLDELMSQTGIQRAGKGRNKARNKAPPRQKTQPKRPTAAPPRPARSAPSRAPVPPTPGKQERLEALESLVQTLRSELDRARAERDALRAQLKPMTRERDEALEAARLARDTNRILAARMTRVEQDNPQLATVLEEQGFRGPDERAAAVRALLDARRWGEIESILVPIEPKLLRERLDRHALLHCGESDCPSPAGVALVRVGRERCELCQGQGQGSLYRAVSDCMMLNGCKLLLLRGGRPWEHRLLRDGVDRRLKVDLDRGQDEPEALRVAWGLPARDGELSARPGLPGLVAALKSWSESL